MGKIKLTTDEPRMTRIRKKEKEIEEGCIFRYNTAKSDEKIIPFFLCLFTLGKRAALPRSEL
jgi:hypothetical protein